MFQRIMNMLLADVPQFAFTFAFMDNMVVFSAPPGKTDHLHGVLAKLYTVSLTIKLKRCQLERRKCSDLRHVVGWGKVKLEETKVRDIKDFQRRVKKKDVRSFLSLATYFQRFIPTLSTTAAPLTDLTKKDVPDRVLWGDEQETAFEQLKEELATNAVLQA